MKRTPESGLAENSGQTHSQKVSKGLRSTNKFSKGQAKRQSQKCSPRSKTQIHTGEKKGTEENNDLARNKGKQGSIYIHRKDGRQSDTAVAH